MNSLSVLKGSIHILKIKTILKRFAGLGQRSKPFTGSRCYRTSMGNRDIALWTHETWLLDQSTEDKLVKENR